MCTRLFTKMKILLLLTGITLCNLGIVYSIENGCPVEGQIFQQCSSCSATCSNPNPICIATCIPGCACPAGQVIDTLNNKCVSPKQCPLNCAVVLCLRPNCGPGEVPIVPEGQCCALCVDPCKNHKCPVGSRCRVYEPTGEAFCEPSCDLNNGGCPGNQECTLKTVQCATDPCPPVVECTPRCPIQGQVYQKCPSCPATCIRPFPKCSGDCIPGCACPPGQVVDTVNKKCISINQCPSLDHAAVLCAIPQCAANVTTAVPPGQCCPVCACHLGDELYYPGETCKQGCNDCTCSVTGLPLCTTHACFERK